ncbi:hypothetical protein OOT00_14775 [Desulfobotulus sp. H1]|uniref:Type 4 fimbrial biogenesis protein PilX N-terminal domain-containing protein n=1 Tax=Desulfobotulus pelophilus TaxID=2823377 RepID=A0ABT3NCR0_9BACT|nr:hypothetical protein [Desulfobotulus pelophilus]MCW7755249.1 hypothetical protein [Desulfobotulus pelophilus]
MGSEKDSLLRRRTILKPLSSSRGMALLTTLLILTLMILSGFALLYFATMDIRISGNDSHSRVLLYRVEALGLYASQLVLQSDPEIMLEDCPERPGWIRSEEEASSWLGEGFQKAMGEGRTGFSVLTDEEFSAFIRAWPDWDTSSLLTVNDASVFPFIGEGRGRVLVVDMGPADIGSQDMGTARMNALAVFSEYEDVNGGSRFLEIGLLRKQ